VGYATPEEWAALMTWLYGRVPALRDQVLSVHCHDDLGMAVANSLAAVRVGARQVEGCINGIGERAGNASVEEIVTAVRLRPDAYGVQTRIDHSQIYRTSRLVSQMTGMLVQPNKAMGFELGDEEFRRAFVRFKQLADRKKEVTERDLESIVADEVRQATEAFKLEHLQVSSGTSLKPTATVRILFEDGTSSEAAAI